jgi:chromosome segregation ATPase
MRIIKLTAENVKRLKAVEIDPDGTVQVITGRNAQGKTSVLDAIWLALGGGAASRETARPVRDGEDSAFVEIDLGDIVVTRTWKGGKTSLTVTSADGARYSSPQSVIDALVGRLSFDPLEFTRLSNRDQVAALLDLVELDVDPAEIAVERQRLYDLRTSAGQRGKALGEVPAQIPDVPDTEVSASDLIGQIREAEDANRVVTDARERYTTLTKQISDLEQQLSNARAALAAAATTSQRELVDVQALHDSLAKVEDTNRLVRANADARAKAADRDRIKAEYDSYTAKIDELDKSKADALAKATFPVVGLGFDDNGVTYNGVPFSQASAAEQIRVSLAMAMSLNPRLRVIRILDGSLLDAENLALITSMAADQDYQIWIERVADGSGIGVVIEDGAIA